MKVLRVLAAILVVCLVAVVASQMRGCRVPLKVATCDESTLRSAINGAGPGGTVTSGCSGAYEANVPSATAHPTPRR